MGILPDGGFLINRQLLLFFFLSCAPDPVLLLFFYVRLIFEHLISDSFFGIVSVKAC